MQKKRLNKRAAIELSMTTIVVIILGITLLSLGLLWVRGTFKDITRLSDDAFRQADGAISDIFEEVDKAVYVSPPSIDLELESGKTVEIKVIVEDRDSSLGIKGCNFEVPAIKNANSDSLVVTVVKK